MSYLDEKAIAPVVDRQDSAPDAYVTRVLVELPKATALEARDVVDIGERALSFPVDGEHDRAPHFDPHHRTVTEAHGSGDRRVKLSECHAVTVMWLEAPVSR